MNRDGQYMNKLMRRAITQTEERLIKYVRDHPGLTIEELAIEFYDTTAVYISINYLVENQFINCNPHTLQLTVGK